jgi:hypothetical protein
MTKTFHGQALKDCPVEAFELCSGPVCFADEDGKVGNRIELKLCDGSVKLHWFWGNMAFNLPGISLAKPKIPILFAHDTDQRLGMSNGHSVEPAFTLLGEFLTNDRAAEIKQDIADGFEFESSLRFDMDKGIITHVKEGEHVMVNGNRLDGPGTVFEKSTIMEGSICVFGAQENCTAKVFSEIKNRKEPKMEKLSLEKFKGDNPELFEEIASTAHAKGKAEGIQGQIVLFGKIQEVCKDPVVAAKCFSDGMDVAQATDAAKDAEILSLRAKLAAKKEAPETQLSEAEKKAAAVLAAKVDPASTEFSDNATDNKKLGGGGGDKLEKDMTEDELKAQFAASKELQDEFGKEKVGTYLAFVAHNSQGDISILKK